MDCESTFSMVTSFFRNHPHCNLDLASAHVCHILNPTCVSDADYMLYQNRISSTSPTTEKIWTHLDTQLADEWDALVRNYVQSENNHINHLKKQGIEPVHSVVYIPNKPSQQCSFGLRFGLGQQKSLGDANSDNEDEFDEHEELPEKDTSTNPGKTLPTCQDPDISRSGQHYPVPIVDLSELSFHCSSADFDVTYPSSSSCCSLTSQSLSNLKDPVQPNFNMVLFGFDEPDMIVSLVVKHLTNCFKKAVSSKNTQATKLSPNDIIIMLTHVHHTPSPYTLDTQTHDATADVSWQPSPVYLVGTAA